MTQDPDGGGAVWVLTGHSNCCIRARMVGRDHPGPEEVSIAIDQLRATSLRLLSYEDRYRIASQAERANRYRYPLVRARRRVRRPDRYRDEALLSQRSRHQWLWVTNRRYLRRR